MYYRLSKKKYGTYLEIAKSIYVGGKYPAKSKFVLYLGRADKFGRHIISNPIRSSPVSSLSSTKTLEKTKRIENSRLNDAIKYRRIINHYKAFDVEIKKAENELRRIIEKDIKAIEQKQKVL